MTYVDSAVLNVTERMCRQFQAWTGRTNVWLAFQLTNLSIVVYFIWVAGLYLLSGDLALRVFVAVSCGGVFFVLTRTVFRTPIEASENAAYRRVAQGLRNPRRIRDVQLRIAFLTLSIVLVYPLWFAYLTLHLRFALLTDALIILTTVVLYVLACDPLPPCAGRVRDWVRGLLPARDASMPTVP
jgi:small-conductance mechanosensitive channel